MRRRSYVVVVRVPRPTRKPSEARTNTLRPGRGARLRTTSSSVLRVAFEKCALSSTMRRAVDSAWEAAMDSGCRAAAGGSSAPRGAGRPVSPLDQLGLVFTDVDEAIFGIVAGPGHEAVDGAAQGQAGTGEPVVVAEGAAGGDDRHQVFRADLFVHEPAEALLGVYQVRRLDVQVVHGQHDVTALPVLGRRGDGALGRVHDDRRVPARAAGAGRVRRGSG